MQARTNKLLSERRAVSALPNQRRTGELAPNTPMHGARLSSAPAGKRSLPLSCTSVVFNNWVSRASSAVSVQSMRTSSNYYSNSDGGRENSGRDLGRRCHSSYRPTRASMLRQKTCPIRNEQPSYQEVIKKRKAFTLRCKSLSASNIRCKTLPDGESLHAFITGARYNRAHHMDSHSLERVGVYIPRHDATRSFVNPSSDSRPLSPEINGAGSKTQLDVTDQGESDSLSTTTSSNQQHEKTNTISANYTNQALQKPERQQSNTSNDNHKWLSTPDKQSNHSNHAKDVAAENDANSIMKPLNERQATSRDILTPTSPATKEMVSDRYQGPKECASSWNEIVPDNSTAVASGNSLDVVVGADRKHVNIKESSSPQHSRADLPTTCTVAAENDQQEYLLKDQTVAHVVSGDESEDELISPEARALITDEILKECQHSTSSFASSTVHQETETMQDNVIKKDSPLPQPEKQTNSPTIGHNGESLIQKNHTEKETTSLGGEDLQDSDMQAAGSERELNSKSSCIFVDMSTLNLDQVQEEEPVD